MIGNTDSIFYYMNSTVLIFNKSSINATSAEALTYLAHELARDSENIRFDAPHAQLRMKQRNIGIRQVLEVLRNGVCVSGPTQDQYGDQRIKLRRMVAGKRVQENSFGSHYGNMRKIMNTTNNYHYLESGLDNIYLLNGFKYIDSPRGKQVTIKDIDGLHKAIGCILIKEKKNLSGKEIRFLRHEMLMSQSTLALLIRMLYAEYIGENNNIRNSLKRIANIEDEIDQNLYELTLKETKDGWEMAA